MRRILLVVIALSLGFVATLRAQTLADRVPADSFAYLGWRGTATADNAYQGSHLQAVLEASKFQATFNEVIPQLISMIEQNDPDAARNVNAGLAILAPLMRHASAIFVRPGDALDSPPRAGVLCQAGADAKQLAQQVRDIVAKSEDAAKHFRVVETGEFVAVLVGYSEDDAKNVLASEGRGLATNPEFVASMKQATPANAPSAMASFVALYVDIKSGLSLLDAAIEHDNKKQAADWRKIRDVLGLTSIHRAYLSAGFDGPNWNGATFVAAPAPRKGLAKLLEGKPISPESLKLIPATAGGAQSIRFDFAEMFNMIRDMVAQIDENAVGTMDQMVGAGQMYLGVNPVTDIMEPLGDTWLLYSDESLAGNGALGLMIVNKLDDQAKAERGLGALWRAAVNFVNAPQRQMPISLRDRTVNDVKLFTVQAGDVQAGWTIHDGRLIIGFNADAVAKAASEQPANGFDQNEKFAALSKQLAGGQQITSFRFMDLPVSAPAMNEQLRQQWMAVAMFASQKGINLPNDPFPPIDVVKAHVAPSAEVSWVTDEGFFSRSMISFPGADAYSNQPDISRSQAGLTAMTVSVLLPSLNRARETANRVKCASNQRQIGQAMLLYSNKHQGEYPPDLGTLLLTQEVTHDVFVCPSSDNSIPPDVKRGTPQQMAEWVSRNSSYVYAGKGLKNDSPAEKIMVMEKLDNHGNDGINCMFGDGHVEFVLPTEANWSQVQELMKVQGK